LKVFIDTNVLIDLAVRVDQYPDSFALVSKLMESSDHSLWISAISVNNIQFIVSKLADKTKVRKLLEMIRSEFSIIPFRKSVFTKTMDNSNPDFEDAIQMYSAREMNMDCIITRNPDDFINSAVTVYTPSQFLEKWNSGELDKTSQVPFLDLTAQHHQIFNDIDDRFADIMANTGFISGKYVDAFEKGFAALHDAPYCIGVSTGTDALHIAMLSLGIGHGDLVIVPVNTFIATAEPVSLCGATPVFVDCDAYFHMDAEKLESLILGMNETDRKRLKAIVPVHLYGQAADMAQILRIAEQHGLDVIEDACQAHLATYNGKKIGTMGKFGAFSFYPGKNLGAFGEAGALVCNHEELAKLSRMIRQHGEIERYHHQVIGHNYRMEAFQGAVLGVKLKYLEKWTARRRHNAALYTELLAAAKEVETPRIRPGADHVFHLYVIQTDCRDELQKFLAEKGIATGLHYPLPLHLQPAYQCLGYRKGDFPVAEGTAGRILSLPMFPELTEKQISYVVDTIKSFWIKKR
jgi:dTDP-4-amino-4,6-dideoxygalactose transaminase/predicted nucleic acid-binding protein